MPNIPSLSKKTGHINTCTTKNPKVLQHGSHLKGKIEYKTFVVLDSQNFSQIVENMGEIEWRKKNPHMKTCKDGWEMREKFFFCDVSVDNYTCKC